MSHIFISYSRKDHEYARKLANELLARGFDVWIDDQIDFGEDWWPTIVKAVRGCVAFVVLMSPESGQSRWVQREVMLADELHKPTFPILLAGDLHSCELWALFIGKQYTNLTDEELPSDRFYELLAQSAPPKAIPGAEVIEASKSSVGVQDTPSAPQPQSVNKPVETLRAAPIKPPSFTSPDLSSILPSPFEWCYVPNGAVTIEYTKTDKQSSNIDEFYIAKYPITNEQYKAFVLAHNGYGNSKWWDYSDESERWRKDNSQPLLRLHPDDISPRTGITWYEAVAFCQWLNAQVQIPRPLQIILPTEKQWQRSAQGDDGRLYPWGDIFSSELCNTIESLIGAPTSVMRYPDGTSPYNVMDLSGNVWEWCVNPWYPANKYDEKRVVARGGAFKNPQSDACVTSRFNPRPQDFSDAQGFRIALCSRSDRR